MYGLLILMAFIFGGCANFTINAAMCDKIASEPNAVIPQECRDYNKKKAQEAFDKAVNSKKVSDKDLEVKKEK